MKFLNLKAQIHKSKRHSQEMIKHYKKKSNSGRESIKLLTKNTKYSLQNYRTRREHTI
jgi:hypothetical protein